jgi:hypothetical protein
MTRLLSDQGEQDEAQIAGTEDPSAASAASVYTPAAVEMRAMAFLAAAALAAAAAAAPHRAAMRVIAAVVAKMSASKHGQSPKDVEQTIYRLCISVNSDQRLIDRCIDGGYEPQPGSPAVES